MHMQSYQQFGIRGLAHAAAGVGSRSFALGRLLLAAAFLGAVCLIAIVIGVASAQ